MTTADSDHCISGTGATPVTGVGTAWRYDDSIALPPEADEDEVYPPAELERYETARQAVHDALDAERERSRKQVGEEEADIFGAHKQFLDDPTIVDATRDAIKSGSLAEHAVADAFEESIEQLAATGGRMAERTDDLRDVRNRLLRELIDEEDAGLGDVPPGVVIIAERLTPSETVALDPDEVAGFVTAEGGRTSHAAIVARSLGIPAVVGTGDSLDAIADDETLLVDGTNGEVVRSPDEQAIENAQANETAEVRDDRVSTIGNHQVEVAANVGSLQAVESAADFGADGIGLFRTEFFFLERDAPPTEEEQFEAFERALSTFNGQRVLVRTLDVGGDKPVPYLDVEAGTNPFLGLRGVRLAPGARPELFKTQIRALLRAAATEHGDALAVMFPLVASVEELDEVLAVVESVAETLDAEGIDYAIPEFGVMIETPAAVFLAPELADRVEFFSIGTNDLTQYIAAASREEERVESLHDPLSPAVLRAIKQVIEAAHATDCWVGMCGEMAGDPKMAPLLVGLGLDELSMSAVTIPEVKSVVDGLYDEAAESLADDALAASSSTEVASLIDEWS
ncbi:phosphoenolpyruvate--protein phosphotransferase [Haloarcula amylovorans]|uniref:phosphoenolpyruvate--protein phosphotransferase n=1 Tax=Haloarcula amylovorans TaxID=2562280 RepID=UPI001075F0D5|nr:phosphoenolpyruvate--protein phosphotransferase [Halomicroarcula amylolytica]